MRLNRIAAIILESLALTLVLGGIAATTIVFQHAAIGLPIFFRNYQIVYPSILRPAADTPPSRQPAQSDPAKSELAILPSHVFLKVPFTPQAPFGNWSAPYNEACEEASLAMAMAWVRGERLAAAGANDEILGQIAYENYHFGYNSDTALRETLKLFTRYYGYQNANVIYDVSDDDIKHELASGNIVIVPVVGTLLNNPYYASPPPYHMLVIRGYDEVAQEFIVNDPGTKRGESFRYPYPTLFNAIHDWTGDEASLLEGPKGMMVVKSAR